MADILVLGGAENQDRNARGGTEDSLERLDTLRIIDRQVQEYGINFARRLLSCEALERGRAAFDPLNGDAGVR